MSLFTAFVKNNSNNINNRICVAQVCRMTVEVLEKSYGSAIEYFDAVGCQQEGVRPVKTFTSKPFWEAGYSQK